MMQEFAEELTYFFKGIQTLTILKFLKSQTRKMFYLRKKYWQSKRVQKNLYNLIGYE